ncbi:mitochondrial carrier [Xylona heveae TC161]|uniref:Mitochondrial carrier n=1 Tax=Xylona heveae (strain CBS 132557 / TC161) TaxID=1328760 RepID=A0A165ADI9_XYLHT|nr:mitochondrial carrier [Xylona heveae TC161]KZF20300.1 mitochondrial carrier [Xylona heveae TC161]
MASSSQREGPNPLRPYYIPPSLGLPPGASISQSPSGNIPGKNGAAAPPASFGTSARDILSDLDYSEYLSDSSPSAGEMARDILDQALWKYTSILLAQPFDVAKTVLQCHLASSGARPLVSGRGFSKSDAEDIGLMPDSGAEASDAEEDSDEEPSYFSSTTPDTLQTSSSRRRRHVTDRAGYVIPPASQRLPHKLELRRTDALLEVISQLWSKEGAWGVWKGTNATFIYSVLVRTIESWTRSLLSALFNVPDPGLLFGADVGGLDVLDSPYPLASLGVAIAAAGLAGVILAPLDIVRTRLILTPTTHAPRALLPSLRSLPSLSCPPNLLPITLLTSTIPTFITTSAPLFLRSRMGIDPILTPTTYGVATFFTSAVELFVRLPLETVLRRGQMSVPLGGKRPAASEAVVDVGPYRGVIGTMWSIVKEEGGAPQEIVPGPAGGPAIRRDRAGQRRGQGVEGLWRGWRVGMWGLVGVWGAAALGSVGARADEF